MDDNLYNNIISNSFVSLQTKKILIMSTREKTNKQKVLDYVQKQFESAKEMKLFQMLRKEVEIGKNGTQRYVIKKGPNKGKIVG